MVLKSDDEFEEIDIREGASPQFLFGAPDPTKQLYSCRAANLRELLEILPDSCNPFSNWNGWNLSMDVLTWFPRDENHVAFYGSGQRISLSYAELHQQAKSCPPYALDMTNKVVAVILPPCYMAEMAVVLVSLMSKPDICVAPLDANMPRLKLLEALSQLDCDGLVTTQEILREHLYWNERDETFANIGDVRTVIPSSDGKAGAVEWKILRQVVRESRTEDKRSVSPKEEPPKLLLRTSGTTSTPKVVPLKASALLYNATCIAASLKLKRDDVGCNAMPLFHIGGIACALLSVLVSGSSVVMMEGPFDPRSFLDCITAANETVGTRPTWYYAAPTLHKTLILAAKSRLQHEGCNALPNKLRFIRSGAAHLPHETAVELSRLFDTSVLPTYSMSECMPICSSTDPVMWNQTSAVIDSVGPPIGCSLCILDDETGQPLPYGVENIGEVAIAGPGVLSAYPGVSRDRSHTPNGHWLRTGDVGCMDKEGCLFLRGRLKEMIKRGGEQVWPNEVDHVVEQVPGVATAVTFGVPNELWGEEVAVAVVLENTNQDHVATNQLIQAACKVHLDSAAVPCQILFLPSTDSLPKSSTGKYLRTRMASHLGVTAADTGALRALELAGTAEASTSMRDVATPSPALNGARFIAACFVAQVHLGLYPNNAWLKIQSYSLNMQIFFMLGAFQLVCAVKSEVLSNWSQFVGSKIGAMHALFFVTQFIALPSYLLFQCGPDGYQEMFEDSSCTEGGFLAEKIVLFIIATATGLLGQNNEVNGVTWFQSVFYVYLMLFPWLDHLIRRGSTAKKLLCPFVICLLLATVACVLVLSIPGLWVLNFYIFSWLPALIAAMIAARFFTTSFISGVSHDREAPPTRIGNIFKNPQTWGVITDLLSVLFILFEVIVALSPDCIWVTEGTFMEMRPGTELPGETMTEGDNTYVYACNVSHDEFVDFVHASNESVTVGRWVTDFGFIVGFARMGTPLVLLWIFSMAFGQGMTAHVLNCRILQTLAPLAYPIYLLHVPISRYYWVATRGLEAENWWNDAGLFPVPVEWYEVFIIVGICLVLGFLIDRLVVLAIMRHTVRLGVAICRGINNCCRRRSTTPESLGDIAQSPSSFSQVERMMRGLTGSEVDRSTNLRDLGLDSLGATALLSLLRASVPAAKTLTMSQLSRCETVGDLVDFLDNRVDRHNSSAV